MFVRAFRIDPSRLHAWFAPRKPRHPLLRLTFGLVGIALLAVLVVVGVFVGAAMLVGGLALRLWQQRGQPTARDRTVVDGRIVEGTYRVVNKPGLPLAR